MVKKLPYFSVAATGWLVAILIGTLTPATDLPGVAFNLNDKIVHLIIFLLFSLLLSLAIKKEKFLNISSRRIFTVVLTGTSIVAASTEILQNFIPGRQMDIYDLVANEVGVFAGLLIYRLVYK